jgi:hypothetical protein
MTMTPTPTTSHPTVFNIISWVETKHNTAAVRFEPAVYEKISVNRTDSQKAIISRIMKANDCSWGTALMIYSTSFGAVQLMGFNIYGPKVNFDGNVIDYCVTPDDQHDSFAKILEEMELQSITVAQLALSKVARAHFAAIYNGPADIDAYAANIVTALKNYCIPVAE